MKNDGSATRWSVPLLGFALVAAFSGCATRQSARTPSAVEEVRVLSRDLSQSVSNFRALVASPKLSRASCAVTLNRVYSDFFDASATFFDSGLTAARAREVVENGFLARLELRRKFVAMHSEGPVDPACVNAVRDAFRVLRFVEEYVAEWMLEPAVSDHALRGEFPSLLINPAAGGKFEFRSGDILLSRGNAVGSAAIARIGDRGGQFSHLAMVYIDEKTKEPLIVQAHIEIGTKVATLEEYMTDGKLRAMLFRQPDEKLAHEAAKIMYERAIKASATGKNIPYDFGMDLDSERTVFCSEVVHIGYKEASVGQLLLPMFRTGIHMKNRKFLNSIGVQKDNIFAPSDMELDPRFELVAEWRDFRKTARARMLDVILSQMYGWMDDHGYTFRKTLGQRFKQNLGWVLRRIPILDKTVADKFPKNMKRSTIGAMLSLSSVVGAILQELEAENQRFMAKHGIAMASRDMRELIERFREADFKRYQDWQAFDAGLPQGDNPLPIWETPEYPKFHVEFRP